MEIDDFEDDLYNHISVKVDPGQGPLRIDKYLLDKMTKVSRSRIQNGIVAGAIKVNQQQVKSNYKVRPNDLITILVPKSEQEDQEIEGEDIPIEVIYEDTDILVLNKPVGLVVHPGIGNRTGTLVNALIYHLQRSDLPVLKGNPLDRPGLVHRIDKNTSGLLVTAKYEYALSHLARQFYEHSSQRSYLALVWGEPKEKEGTIESYLGRDPKDRRKQHVFDSEADGKLAITHYKVIEPMYYVSLVECTLETGRTHQIRIHMSDLGHPLFGDAKYGGAKVVKGTVFQKYKQFVHNCLTLMPHQALHAQSLGFEHPRLGERMHFSVPPPTAFQELLAKWQGYVHSRKSNLDNEED